MREQIAAFYTKWKKYGVQINAVIIANLIVIAEGMHFGWSSPTVPILIRPDSPIPMTTSEGEWVNEALLIGNIIGFPFSILILNRVKRKMGITISCILEFIAWLLILFAKRVELLLLARLIAGIAKNIIYVIIPLYTCEIANPEIRGVLCSIVYLMQNTGVLFVYGFIPYVGYYMVSILGASISTIALLWTRFLPESPYNLLAYNDVEEAKTSLCYLRNSNDVDFEFERIKTAVDESMKGKSSFLQIIMNLFTSRTNLKILVILMVLRSIQILCGMGALTMHIHTIFQQTNGISAEISGIIFAVIVLSSSFAIFFFMDYFGRKTLLQISSVIVGICCVIISVYFYLEQKTNIDVKSLSFIPLLVTIFYIYGYRVGWGTVPIIMVGELFSQDVKVLGVILVDLSYAVSNQISNMMFYQFEVHYGMFAPFLGFTVVLVVGYIFSKYCVPETRHIFLEDIHKMLSGGKNHTVEDFEASLLLIVEGKHLAWRIKSLDDVLQ